MTTGFRLYQITVQCSSRAGDGGGRLCMLVMTPLLVFGCETEGSDLWTFSGFGSGVHRAPMSPHVVMLGN